MNIIPISVDPEAITINSPKTVLINKELNPMYDEQLSNTISPKII